MLNGPTAHHPTDSFEQSLSRIKRKQAKERKRVEKEKPKAKATPRTIEYFLKRTHLKENANPNSKL